MTNTVRPFAFAAAAALATPALAQSGDALFAHKTITINIGNTAGGSYDLYGRMLARFLGRHLPGNPNVVATNMPCAGTLTSATNSVSFTAESVIGSLMEWK